MFYVILIVFITTAQMCDPMGKMSKWRFNRAAYQRTTSVYAQREREGENEKSVDNAMYTRYAIQHAAI